MHYILFLTLVGSTVALLGLGNLQSIAVKGKLFCKEKPAESIRVKLYEVEPVLDRLMDEKYTNETGEFLVSGSAYEVSSIDPKLNIYHKCNYDGLCYKKMAIVIPESFITEGEHPVKTFDIGEINLAASFSGESTDCLN